MVTIKSKREIEYMKEACKVVAKMYEKLKEEIRPGMTTWELDQIAEKTIRSYIGKGLTVCELNKGYLVLESDLIKFLESRKLPKSN